MINIKVSSGKLGGSEILSRQTPGCNGEWDGIKFHINRKVDECDWWVVLHSTGLMEMETVKCDPSNLIYLSMEPTEAVAGTTTSFLKQFQMLALTDPKYNGENIYKVNALNWWVGLEVSSVNGAHYIKDNKSLNYDILSEMKPPRKNKLASIIVSSKTNLIGHKDRIKFIEELYKSGLDKYIDIYGHGHNPIEDKWSAIYPYKYHIALENTKTNNYWSEKIADAYLGYSNPIYYGCDNIRNYFDIDSSDLIDIRDPRKSINQILYLFERDPYQSRIGKITESRNKILNNYNVFNLIAQICNKKAKYLTDVTLKPNITFKSALKKFVKYGIHK